MLNLTAYNGPEGPVEESDSTPSQSETVDAPALSQDAAYLSGRMETRVGDLESGVAELWKSEELSPLSTSEVLSTMDVSDVERSDVIAAQWEWVSEEVLRQTVFDSRVEALSNNSITSWEREMIEAEFISEIAWEDAELITELRALWFEWSRDWAPENVAENLEIMTEDLKVMRDQIEAQGWKFPENKEEFLALWEAMNQNDRDPDENFEIDPAAASAMGIDAIRDPDGWFQIDPNSEWYRQVGGMVVWPPGAPFSQWGQVFTGTGEISNAVNENLDTSYSWLQQNPWNPMPAEHAARLQNPENKEHIEKVVPPEWHWSAVKLANAEGGTLNPLYPIMIASMKEKRGIVCYPDGKVDDFPIIIWSGGYREWAHSWGNTTPTYEVFNMNMNTKVTAEWVDASNSGSTTVLWASIQSPQWADSGGKWWHGVSQSRIPGWATAGCIGWNQNSMMLAWRAVLSAWGGYGFNVNQKTG